MKPMLFRLLAIVTLVATGGCVHHPDLRKPSTQANFGVQMARMNLWREAMFRFQRAVEIDPQDARARNNLAVAYEANGDFEKARKEYLEALKLDRSNQYIQKNYSRFVEFLSRNRKRQPNEAQAASLKTPPGVSAAAAGASQSSAAPSPPAATEPAKPVSPPAPPSDLAPQHAAPAPAIAPPTTANPNPTPPAQPPAGGAR